MNVYEQPGKANVSAETLSFLTGFVHSDHQDGEVKERSEEISRPRSAKNIQQQNRHTRWGPPSYKWVYNSSYTLVYDPNNYTYVPHTPWADLWLKCYMSLEQDQVFLRSGLDIHDLSMFSHHSTPNTGRSSTKSIGEWIKTYLVGGFNPSEKYESRIGSSSQLLGKINKCSTPPTRYEIYHVLGSWTLSRQRTFCLQGWSKVWPKRRFLVTCSLTRNLS